MGPFWAVQAPPATMKQVRVRVSRRAHTFFTATLASRALGFPKATGRGPLEPPDGCVGLVGGGSLEPPRLRSARSWGGQARGSNPQTFYTPLPTHRTPRSAEEF